MEAEACACACDDFDMPSICREEFPTARKEHKCCECGRIIRKGEKYQLIEGKWEGVFDRFKTCMQCQAIRRDYGRCAPLMYLRDDIWELLHVDIHVSGSWEDEEE